MPRSARAASRPGTSVLWPWRRPAANTTVFAAPTSAASGSMWSSSGSTARLSGMVSDRPAQSGPQEARRPGRAASSHSMAW